MARTPVRRPRPSTAGQGDAARIGNHRPFGALFEFTVSRDKRSAAGARYQFIVFQDFWVDEGGTAASGTSELVHYATLFYRLDPIAQHVARKYKSNN
jgi:hypothetical protein